MKTLTLLSVTFDKRTWDVEHALTWLYNKQLSSENGKDTGSELVYAQRRSLPQKPTFSVASEEGVRLTYQTTA